MIANLFKKKKREFSKNHFFIKIGGILLLIVVAGLLFADFKIYQKKKELLSQVLTYENQIAQIKKRNEALKEGIANSSNSDYIEKVAREELDMQKPGEKVVGFIMPKQKPEQAQTKDNSWLGWLSGAWGWIKSKF